MGTTTKPFLWPKNSPVTDSDPQADPDRSAADHESVLRKVAEAPDADESPSRASRRRKIVGGMVVLFAIAACAIGVWFFPRPVEQATEPVPRLKADEYVRQQISAVEAGESSQIEIDETVVADADLEPLRGSTGIETVQLDRGKISDEGMKTLASLPNLQHLRLRYSPITDDGLALLAGCEKLRVLNLPHAACTGDGLAALKPLNNLRQLRIGSKLAGNNICRTIAQLHSLRAVHLVDIPITDDGLKQLVKLPQLESLYLDGAAVTDEGWKWFFANHSHLHIHLDQKHHDSDPNWHPH